MSNRSRYSLMVKTREKNYLLADNTIDVTAWQTFIAAKYSQSDLQLIQQACVLAQLSGENILTETGKSCFQTGLAIADLLIDLEMDAECISASIVYKSVQHAELPVEDVTQHLGKDISKLVASI